MHGNRGAMAVEDRLVHPGLYPWLGLLHRHLVLEAERELRCPFLMVQIALMSDHCSVFATAV